MSEDKKPWLKNRDYRFIAFEKWRPSINKPDADHEDSEYYESDYFERENEDRGIPDPVRTQFQIHQELSAEFAKQFDFWTIYCKFHLSNEFIKQLSELPGVELIVKQCTTNYRTRISIAKLFDPAEVRRNINELAENYVNSHSDQYGVILNSKPVKLEENSDQNE